MSGLALYEEVDRAVEAMLNEEARAGELDPVIEALASVGRELRLVPDPDFRERLYVRLADVAKRQYEDAARERQIEPRPAFVRAKKDEGRWGPETFPTLFGTGESVYAVRGSSFAMSMMLHTAMLVFVMTAGFWAVEHRHEVEQQVVSLIGGPSEYSLLVAKDKAGGGGGGGDRDKIAASKGAPPRFAKEQIVPPQVVIRNDNPKLTADMRVVGPPEIDLSQSKALGDPLSAVLGSPSNGTGSGGGIGSGTGTGVGPGTGPGVGPGHGGGYGGGAYRVGGGVSAPRAIYAPDPEYSEEARKAKYQGTVLLWLVVGPDGRSHEVRVQRSLGMGLDEQAVEAVKKWRFEPALKDGRPVPVQIYVEVNFRLY